MDHAFLMRAERMLERQPAPAIEHMLLVATLSAHQAASATARAAERCSRGGDWRLAGDAIAELIAGGPAWREARRAQRGSFHPNSAISAGKDR
ncbi:MAG TPA: hypothetical protein VF577_00095 [Allosphingosinicella sp.]|jgi:hypothetical protein